MRRPFFSLSALTALLLGAAACSSDPGSLVASPSILGNLGVSLLSCNPLPYSARTATIGPNGGVLTFGPHSLVVNKGALTKTVTIRAEVISDTVNSVRFSPEGLRFGNAGATLTLSYANCTTLPLPKQVVYTDERLSILELIQSLDNTFQKKVTGKLNHFSRYAVAY